jgi:Protein of unknown function (DUF2550)
VGEGLALDAVWLFAAVLALIVLAAAALASRRFLLERGGGTVECGLRSPAGSGTWRLGVASYEGDDLGWYGALGVRFRPEQVFHRRSLRVLSRRPSLPSESSVLGPEHTVVELDSDAGRVELAMTAEALTGFLSWLEASPPGSHLEDIALFSSRTYACLRAFSSDCPGCGAWVLWCFGAFSRGLGAAPDNAP